MGNGYVIWPTVVRSDMRGLEAIQRKALALCPGLSTTFPGVALEVAAGVVPLGLRLSEIAIATAAKIMAKLPQNHLKQKLDKAMDSDNLSQGRVYTPNGLAVTQVNDMKLHTVLGIEFVQT